MTKKQDNRNPSVRPLPSEYLTVDYPPSDHNNQISVRGGTRKPSPSEIKGDQNNESAETKKEG